MELCAVLELLRSVPDDPMVIQTDSGNVVGTFTGWLERWRLRGMRTSKGEPVQNLELVEDIASILQTRQVTFEKVQGHSGHPLNEAADGLARAAAEAERERLLRPPEELDHQPERAETVGEGHGEAIYRLRRAAIAPAEADQDSFTVAPRRLAPPEWVDARWSVYLMRFDLAQRNQPSALKIGMVGLGTIGRRMREHRVRFGPAEVLASWTLAHAAAQLDELASWRLTEQYEARLQFAPEFADPTARLRRLRPDTLVYSYEWFEDDHRVIAAVDQWALRPVTLPHGWMFATDDPSTIRDQPRD